MSATLTADRTYWHVPGARSWHGLLRTERTRHFGYCGRSDTYVPEAEIADRVPPNAHLCGSCARVIASRTDVESW